MDFASLSFLRDRPLILDAAHGTRLVAHGLDLAHDDPTLWSLDHPEHVAELHQLDIAAGSDALLTNSFGANRVWLAKFGREHDVAAINRAAAALARAAAGAARLVFGDIGPTAGASIEEQVELLIEAGVNALALETFSAEAALDALGRIVPCAALPIIVSLTAWPDDAGDLAHRFEDLGVAAIGVNCVPAAIALEVATRLRIVSRLPLFVKPAGSTPRGPLETPNDFERLGIALAALAPVLVGGCCGSDERHVAALRRACYDTAARF